MRPYQQNIFSKLSTHAVLWKNGLQEHEESYFAGAPGELTQDGFFEPGGVGHLSASSVCNVPGPGPWTAGPLMLDENLPGPASGDTGGTCGPRSSFFILSTSSSSREAMTPSLTFCNVTTLFLWSQLRAFVYFWFKRF